MITWILLCSGVGLLGGWNKLQPALQRHLVHADLCFDLIGQWAAHVHILDVVPLNENFEYFNELILNKLFCSMNCFLSFFNCISNLWIIKQFYSQYFLYEIFMHKNYKNSYSSRLKTNKIYEAMFFSDKNNSIEQS